MSQISARYYGLDALRATMLLTGIAFHLAIPYAGFTLPGYFVTDQRSHFLQIATAVTHYFRMPVFFLLSGFFSALLWERHGRRQFLKTRFRRIGLVGLVALIVMSPVVDAISVYNHFAAVSATPWTDALNVLDSRQIDAAWLQKGPMHLWFLEYLMIFCVGAAAVVPFLGNLFPWLDQWIERVIRSRSRCLLLAIPTTATLSFMPFAMMPYPPSFVPWFGISMGYGWYYVVGWLIFRRRDAMIQLANRTWVEKIAVPITVLVSVVLMKKKVEIGFDASTPLIDVALAFSTAVFIWSMIILLVAASQRIRPRSWLPYLADSSYWIYLVHYPIASAFPALLRHWSLSPVIKVAIGSAMIFLVLLAIYDRFVRYTFLGRALNGKRLRTPPLAAAATAGRVG